MRIFLAVVVFCLGYSHERKSMEALIALTGLGALGGLVYLFAPAPPLPTEADFKKAQEKLQANPEDPDANLVSGKYMAFVLGDYDGGMAFLAKSSDKTLRTLAEHERAPLYADTAPKKVGLADEWVSAAKSFPALFRIFYDRAAYHYAAAWPDLDPVWKEKVRERGMKLAAARPAGGFRKGVPGGWVGDPLPPGATMPTLDGTIAHTGSYSVRMNPGDPKVKGSWSQLKTDVLAIPQGSKELEYSAYVMSNGTDNANDRLVLYFVDRSADSVYVPLDTPMWKRVGGKVRVPDNAVRVVLGLIQNSGKGNIWIDDTSVKVDGREILKNPSFEQ